MPSTEELAQEKTRVHSKLGEVGRCIDRLEEKKNMIENGSGDTSRLPWINDEIGKRKKEKMSLEADLKELNSRG